MATREELEHLFHERGINFETPGFYDDLAFQIGEREDSISLSTMANMSICSRLTRISGSGPGDLPGTRKVPFWRVGRGRWERCVHRYFGCVNADAGMRRCLELYDGWRCDCVLPP